MEYGGGAVSLCVSGSGEGDGVERRRYARRPACGRGMSLFKRCVDIVVDMLCRNMMRVVCLTERCVGFVALRKFVLEQLKLG